MKKLNAKRLAALAMTLVMLLGVLTACGDKADTNNGSGDGEGFPTMTIQIAHVNPTTDDDQYNKLATLFAEKVTAATDGAVTFEICGNSELGGEADVLTGFDLGTHQMGIITNGSYGNLYGPSLVVELPFIFKDNETAWNFLEKSPTACMTRWATRSWPGARVASATSCPRSLSAPPQT